MPGFLRQQKSIEELEQEEERSQLEATIAERKAMAKEMERRHGKGWTSMFKGIKSGIDWEKVKFSIGNKR